MVAVEGGGKSPTQIKGWGLCPSRARVYNHSLAPLFGSRSWTRVCWTGCRGPQRIGRVGTPPGGRYDLG